MAQSPARIKVIGLSLANGLVALSGALNTQKAMQFDITSGTGIMVMGLAAVIIGVTIFKKISFVKLTSGVLFGMVCYKACISIAISSGMQSSDTNLIITVLFIATLLLNSALSKKKGVSKRA